ncbi:MAG TPA: HAMP domain-containing sensor histidine kinase, partial [Anaerolineae bacterium]
MRAITGTVIARTYDLSSQSLPLSAGGLSAVQGGSGWFETAQVEDQPLLIYSRPVTTPAQTVEIVQVAFPLTQAEQTLNGLRLILLAGSSFAILLALGVGWVLAGAALSPIHRITQTAQAIGAEHNFARRVDHQGPTDEVGQLAITFNNMLAELEVAYHQLENALDSQRRFVADASHELRTPLTTVRGNVELLQHETDLDSQERVEILTDTTDEVDRLIRLVNQLLLLARADAGQRLRREPVAVKPLLQDVYRQAKLLAPEAAILCEPLDDQEVLGDRDALKQVLLILVDNAHMHAGPETTIELASHAEDGEVAISVRDSGAGIAPEALPHIFERFYRGKVSRSGPGTGLGLAIARELVEGQEGQIVVESQVGRGSIFTVTLPRVEA